MPYWVFEKIGTGTDSTPCFRSHWKRLEPSRVRFGASYAVKHHLSHKLCALRVTMALMSGIRSDRDGRTSAPASGASPNRVFGSGPALGFLSVAWPDSIRHRDSVRSFRRSDYHLLIAQFGRKKTTTAATNRKPAARTASISHPTTCPETSTSFARTNRRTRLPVESVAGGSVRDGYGRYCLTRLRTPFHRMRQPTEIPFVRGEGMPTVRHDHGPDAFDDVPKRPNPRTVLERGTRDATVRSTRPGTETSVRGRAVSREVST